MIDNEKLNLGNDLEKQIIAMAIADRGFFIHCHGMLKPNHFQNETQAKTWKFFQLYFAKYNTLPPESVIIQALTQAIPGLDQKEFVESLHHFDATAKNWIKDEVLKIVKQQQMKAFVLKAASEISKPAPDYDSLLVKAKEIIMLNPDVNLGTDYFKARERYAKIIGESQDRISTGFPSLDKNLGGGFSRKELSIFMGAAGLGKCDFYESEIEIEYDDDKIEL